MRTGQMRGTAKENFCACGKKSGEKGKSLFTSFCGVKISVSARPEECDDCSQKRAIQEFKVSGCRTISQQNGKMTVDWKRFVELSKDPNSPIASIVMGAAHEQGFLSQVATGNYAVLEKPKEGFLKACEVNLGPSAIYHPFFFSSALDGYEYAREKYPSGDWTVKRMK